ncbi:1-(5-phosphoribosyl)-5-[(5-phosphoribosylamino)methylideneamino]imidazole-4-carboxamide isomerase [Anaerotignum propionicum]|jgi:phosphoribosylformimino-5-aminoimidazole carboxamide ribotide isomerase|uniref:1-(5-phosphoribosyl)-5-[(5-phosphoribosylamino)methylideneamino] imidazole-4-carboxamide isomerase n=1 Tax=Anaerotignum propionicum DSM 1682 TaxID=991789 RepID=A0A0X8VA69_ANAPI|nr:1-(5-phosphoribosyl)-5-[(5-phosphoribosylamino)methylideneamino]imidazole-4-carboxamide isomerase [Anaerotignum propionicum]AMJ40218.1 1-(5-phosphoribosyl)-5-[(5-phosphoribosylamino)methylideneamino] imidazole-4-carboxamide isomerase [Anaerotignum propionicum DSM 1682]SHF10670.1 1-(5-phosphoribosyl)-5-[(5-phosphoribosylamino)methylideneamino] imidazole-4-carboxamide isomerase [[Clostridium] propionicum DSM 1682] [Anaerotignum propionicum DSM 1682]
MKLFPAIDIIEGCAVRLVKGDYAQKTVYSKQPVAVAKGFAKAGATYLHLVDLEGAKDGGTPNLEVIRKIVKESGLLVEVGGGIRSEGTIQTYLEAGVFRVILGTAAVGNPDFLKDMVVKYGERIAVGVDIKDGMVAVKGWTELSQESCFDFCEKLEKIGVKTIICTDISKDGLLAGTNLALYRDLSEKFRVDIVASGGVTTLADVEQLQKMGLYGAILGKALYTGNIDLKKAIDMTKEERL